MLSSEIISGFREKGYEVENHVLNAAEYGVLQNRRRIILIGWRKESSHYYPVLS
ncbi:MAG: DNA cytosine methyltransferase [Lachnospiraceae bacterium]